MYIFYLELYRTSIGAIWILQLKGLLGQKASLSPGCPSLQRFQKRRNLSAIVFTRFLWLLSYEFILLLSFSWTYNQYWVPMSAYHGSLLFIVYTQGCHFFKLKNLKINNFFKIQQMSGVYAGVEPANYSLYIGSSLPFD